VTGSAEMLWSLAKELTIGYKGGKRIQIFRKLAAVDEGEQEWMKSSGD
jgi:hypothetical protein